MERRLDQEPKVDLGILWGGLAGQYYDSFVGVRGKERYHWINLYREKIKDSAARLACHSYGVQNVEEG